MSDKFVYFFIYCNLMILLAFIIGSVLTMGSVHIYHNYIYSKCTWQLNMKLWNNKVIHVFCTENNLFSCSEDLLGDDLGDHSLADYNLGNDEEDQLLADDYEGGNTQNVPSSIESFREPADMVPSDYSGHGMEYRPQVSFVSYRILNLPTMFNYSV